MPPVGIGTYWYSIGKYNQEEKTHTINHENLSLWDIIFFKKIIIFVKKISSLMLWSFFYLEISITVNVAVQSKPPVKFYQGEKFK